MLERHGRNSRGAQVGTNALPIKTNERGRWGLIQMLLCAGTALAKQPWRAVGAEGRVNTHSWGRSDIVGRGSHSSGALVGTDALIRK